MFPPKSILHKRDALFCGDFVTALKLNISSVVEKHNMFILDRRLNYSHV